MKQKLLLFTLSFGIVFWSTISNVLAQISIPNTSFSYIETFDSYNPSNSTNFNNTIPSGWTGTSSGTASYQGQGTGTGNAGGYWAYGTSSEFSLGALRSGTPGNITYTVSFTNNTGKIITQLSISYDFEQWRYANTSGFTVTATGLGSANVSGLSQAGTSSGTNGTPTTTPMSVNLSGLSVADGATFSLRFLTSDPSGSDNGIAIDYFVLNGIVVLPISLKSFTATPLDRSAALLSFATALEQNNDYFSIERSTDGLRFSEIGRVQGAGNSLQTREYSYTDNTPLRGINYYRLKQVDYDGKYTFSPVVSLNFDGTDRGNGVRLSPQPVKDQLSVTLEQAFQQDARWELYDLSGRLLQAGTLAAEANSFSIQAATLTDGAYVLRITGDQQVITRKFEKN